MKDYSDVIQVKRLDKKTIYLKNIDNGADCSIPANRIVLPCNEVSYTLDEARFLIKELQKALELE